MPGVTTTFHLGILRSNGQVRAYYGRSTGTLVHSRARGRAAHTAARARRDPRPAAPCVLRGLTSAKLDKITQHIIKAADRRGSITTAQRGGRPARKGSITKNVRAILSEIDQDVAAAASSPAPASSDAGEPRRGKFSHAGYAGFTTED